MGQQLRRQDPGRVVENALRLAKLGVYGIQSLVEGLSVGNVERERLYLHLSADGLNERLFLNL